jgi:hypothetical protein
MIVLIDKMAKCNSSHQSNIKVTIYFAAVIDHLSLWGQALVRLVVLTSVLESCLPPLCNLCILQSCIIDNTKSYCSGNTGSHKLHAIAKEV